MAEERWRPVPDWEGFYEVSDQGRVRRVKPMKRTYVGRILNHFVNNKGYHQVRMSDHDRHASACVHVLVAQAFIGPRPDRHQCDHKDGDKDNNTLPNLEWVTPGVNMQRSVRLGLHKRLPGALNGRAKLTWEDIAQIRSSTEPAKVLAARFGVTHRSIYSIRNNKQWVEQPPTTTEESHVIEKV